MYDIVKDAFIHCMENGLFVLSTAVLFLRDEFVKLSALEKIPAQFFIIMIEVGLEETYCS